MAAVNFSLVDGRKTDRFDVNVRISNSSGLTPSPISSHPICESCPFLFGTTRQPGQKSDHRPSLDHGQTDGLLSCVMAVCTCWLKESLFVYYRTLISDDST
jgi:hypothetical protein